MRKFLYLQKLNEHIDDAFVNFYNTMLNDVRLSIFFESDEHVKRLIEKQKAYFIASLTMDIPTLKSVYIKLGEMHWDLRIPYVDFIKGSEILQEHFLLHTQKVESIGLMDEVFEYFKLMKAYTSKGYLNRMIVEDKKDIKDFFEQSSIHYNPNLPQSIVLEKIKWLSELLDAIEQNIDFSVDESTIILDTWLNELKFISLEKRKFLEDMQHRIIINTKNLFYFLEREEYFEILPLYTALLSVYKLTFMMNNAITLEFANKLIENMKMDSLTQLYRKDLFDELLKSEISLLSRHDSYSFCLVFIDLDNFKLVNDNFGHYSGDKVIEKLGEQIRKNIRASDLAFRIGGDEFALILKHATKKEAKNVASKIKIDFNSIEFKFTDDISFNVGASIGVIEQNSENRKDFKNLLESVDKKLYEAKNRGKNQICL